jgi:Ca2+-binding RTX toxin-like protein
MGAIVATRHNGGRRRTAGTMIFGGLASVSGIGLVVGTGAGSAHAAGGPTAVFTLGVLTVVGDGQDNAIVISRDPAGTIVVNGGAIPIGGGTPTVANTRAITLLGLGGNDTLTIDEANGALPAATEIGGGGNDIITGGSAADLLIGQAGNDALFGKGGNDRMFGGADNDALIGGDGDDQAFGEAGDDRMIWNPGDDTDLNEGGADTDNTEVNGGNGAEQFAATANGTRVRFDRVDPAPFSIDMGTTENLLLHANGGDDSFATSGNLAALVRIIADGGAGDDRILGSNGDDLLIGGDGTDFIDGNQGNDTGFLGAGDDTFQWDPGDGSDLVEGQEGADTMLFNGANVAENFDVSADGRRVRFLRNVANIDMNLDDVERIDLKALGGADNLVVHDMNGTDLTSIDTDLANPPTTGTDDGAADTVTIEGTMGSDVITAAGQAGAMDIQGLGLATAVSIEGASPTTDRVTISAQDGDDVVDASGVKAGTALVTIDLGNGDDVGIGGDGDDTILGGAGDDVLIGGPGTDTLDGGPGDNVLIDGENIVAGAVADDAWLASHTHEVAGKSVLENDGKSYDIPAADLAAA